jgi:PelA/Pel-15E family pectate lyase
MNTREVAVNQIGALSLSAIFCMAGAISAAAVQSERAPTSTSVKWENCLSQKPEWYGSQEAVRIADSVLLYQRDSGGWPKNIDMAARLTEQQKATVLKRKRDVDSTIDNGATYMQIAYLAKVYTAVKLDRHKAALTRGVDCLLEAQYDNGGWPQYYPKPTGYQRHITFNDGAMIGVLKVLRDITQGEADFAWVDDERRRRAEEAVRKGLECILKTQVVVDGKRTVWCAQHHEATLTPAGARKYELASLSGSESVDIVRFLMGIDRPNDQVVNAIVSAIEWFERSKITGIRLVERPDASQRGFDRVVVQDPEAQPLWARFYEIGTNRPIFAGRDGIARYSLAEIDAERRRGYRWYDDAPVRLLVEDYPAWRKRIGLRQ